MFVRERGYMTCLMTIIMLVDAWSDSYDFLVLIYFLTIGMSRNEIGKKRIKCSSAYFL